MGGLTQGEWGAESRLFWSACHFEQYAGLTEFCDWGRDSTGHCFDVIQVCTNRTG